MLSRFLKQAAITRAWRQEFGGFDAERLRRDLVAGLTVAAGGLTAGTAFGVASNAAYNQLTADGRQPKKCQASWKMRSSERGRWAW